MSKPEQWRETKLKKGRKSHKNLWNYNEGSSICVIGIPEEEDEEEVAGKILKEIVQKDFQIWPPKIHIYYKAE